MNILSQKTQPLACFNHCWPPKYSFVHHQMSAHNCRLRNWWWQVSIKSSSLRTLPLVLFCILNCYLEHSWQTAYWHSPLFALWHMTTKYKFLFKWVAWFCLKLMDLQSFPTNSSTGACESNKRTESYKWWTYQVIKSTEYKWAYLPSIRGNKT